VRLAATFRYFISQRLIPQKAGGRIAVLKILKSTLRTREYIEKGESEGKTLLDAIRDGEIDGMQDFDSVIRTFIEGGMISLDDGLSYATNQNNLLLQLKGLSSTEDYVGDGKPKSINIPGAPIPAPATTTCTATGSAITIVRSSRTDARSCSSSSASTRHSAPMAPRRSIFRSRRRTKATTSAAPRSRVRRAASSSAARTTSSRRSAAARPVSRATTRSQRSTRPATSRARMRSRSSRIFRSPASTTGSGRWRTSRAAS